MTENREYRALTADEVRQLVAQGCTVEGDEWRRVQVAEGFAATRVRDAYFGGQVTIGRLDPPAEHSASRGAAIERARIVDCSIGDQVRIVNVGVELANYDIDDGASIEDVGTMNVSEGAQFGNGVEVEVLNEGGGREVVLFDQLSSQFAHMLCLHRYRPQLIENLQQIAGAAAEAAHSRRGRIGTRQVSALSARSSTCISAPVRKSNAPRHWSTVRYSVVSSRQHASVRASWPTSSLSLKEQRSVAERC